MSILFIIALIYLIFLMRSKDKLNKAKRRRMKRGRR